MTKSITVKVTKNYGVEAIYPADKTAELFARLTGTKTISRSAIETIKNLGFEVKVEQVQL
jgi:hypothetical protein